MRRMWINLLIVFTGVLLGLLLRAGDAYLSAREGADQGEHGAEPTNRTEPAVWSFETTDVGQLPSDWKATKTGDGPGSVWQVQDDATAPAGSRVITQVSDDGPNRLFNLCVANDTCYSDVYLSVAFKAIRGKLDQGGGPVWRYVDADNYYVARFNPLENNYRVYKVVAGKRIQLATAATEAAANEWHRLRIVHLGDHIQCYLNGQLFLEVHDTTFDKPGKIGLWTKADAVTSFDQLLVAGRSAAGSVVD